MNTELRDAHETRKPLFFNLLEMVDFVEGEYWRKLGYCQDEIILRQGECSGSIFLIMEGNARVLGDMPVGDDYHVRPGMKDLGPGEVFGEYSLLDRGAHSATVKAMTPCELILIDNEKLLEYLDAHRDLGYQIYRELAVTLVKNLRGSHEKILSLLAWGFKVHGYDKYMKHESYSHHGQ